MKYFAYGSNMLIDRIKCRVPSASSPVRVELAGYALKFHKRSVDGSAKCNIVESDNPEARVCGVVFDINEADKPALDRYEGLNSGYIDEVLEVQGPDGPIQAYAYIAEDSAIDDDLVPYDWYKELVIQGATQNSLPRKFIDELVAVESKADPDEDRSRKYKKKSLTKRKSEFRMQLRTRRGWYISAAIAFALALFMVILMLLTGHMSWNQAVERIATSAFVIVVLAWLGARLMRLQ